MKGPTLQEVAGGVYRRGVTPGMKDEKRKELSIAAGLQPKPFPMVEGLREITPEQLLSLRIPRLELRGDRIEGYQREVSRSQITRMIEAIIAGKELPPIMVSLYGNAAWGTDGQHRALAAIATKTNISAVIQKRTMEEQIALFSDQAKARRPSSDLLILRSSGPFEEYIQDAVTSPDGEHPWARLCATRAGDPRRLSPTTVRRMLRIYVAGIQGKDFGAAAEARWDRELADQLGDLMGVFGNRERNPHAFSATASAGIALAARYAIRDNGSEERDIERWGAWMVKFPFQSYAYIKNSGEYADRLLAHWNKRLSAEKKVYRV